MKERKKHTHTQTKQKMKVYEAEKESRWIRNQEANKKGAGVEIGGSVLEGRG